MYFFFFPSPLIEIYEKCFDMKQIQILYNAPGSPNKLVDYFKNDVKRSKNLKKLAKLRTIMSTALLS